MANSDQGAAPLIAPWVRRLTERHPWVDAPAVAAAARQLANGHPRPWLDTGLDLADLVADMEMDTTTILAALFCHPARHAGMEESTLADRIGESAAKLAMSVAQLADCSFLDLTSSRMLASEAKDQTANIRRMLVAVIDDGRVAVLKLAERVVALRRAKGGSEERKTRIAAEVLTVFVPLADRFGTWQLKWELEDLALRYLEPDAYKRIARQLAGRRAEREARVQRLVGELQATFKAHGLKAEMQGRAKHIYSIWRKMRAKHIPIDEVYDLEAVRIIVRDLADCYLALRLIHQLWRHIPEEFDDYIAMPKDNGYQSIHAAVVAADGRAFEVQIRTEEMHRQAELGVCAHWSYKGLDDEDEYYANKVAWMRQAVEAHDREGVDLAGELIDRAQERRVFVHTPKGQVVDLMAGATPVDFAYRIHTEVGHKCVGARVDGHLVPLNAPLQSGQRVRILTDPAACPQRAWLDRDLGYVRTSRAKSKIRAWLWEQGPQENIAAGKAALMQIIDGLSLPMLNQGTMLDLAKHFEYEDTDRLLLALSVGEVGVLDVLGRYLAEEPDVVYQPSLFEEAPAASAPQRQRISIEAGDREGLLRDVTVAFSRFGLSMISNNAHVDALSGIVRMDIVLKTKNLGQLAQFIHHLRHIPDVRLVCRKLRA